MNSGIKSDLIRRSRTFSSGSINRWFSPFARDNIRRWPNFIVKSREHCVIPQYQILWSTRSFSLFLNIICFSLSFCRSMKKMTCNDGYFVLISSYEIDLILWDRPKPRRTFPHYDLEQIPACFSSPPQGCVVRKCMRLCTHIYTSFPGLESQFLVLSEASASLLSCPGFLVSSFFFLFFEDRKHGDPGNARLIGRMLCGSVDMERWKRTPKKRLSREAEKRRRATRKCVRWKRDKGTERRKEREI